MMDIISESRENMTFLNIAKTARLYENKIPYFQEQKKKTVLIGSLKIIEELK